MEKPRNVRSFWVEGQVIGRKTNVKIGTKAQTDRMDIKVFQRDHGDVTQALTVICDECEGTLRTRVIDPNTGETLFVHTTTW